MTRTGFPYLLRNLMRQDGFRTAVKQVLARLLGREQLEQGPDTGGSRGTRGWRGGGVALLAAGVLAGGLGPAAAIALADGGGGGTGGTGLPGPSTNIVTAPSTSSPTTTVTTPCSGSVGTASTTTTPATTTTVPTTATVTTTITTSTTSTQTTTTGTVTTTTPVTTPITTTVPTTATTTTPGTTTVTVTPPCTTTSPPPSTIAVPKTNPFRGRAMWIWQLANSDGGNVAAIIAQAKRYRIGALYIKSSDGTSYWPQFSRALVSDLHEAGIKVCAWQYVYGVNPTAEANLGARALRNGADCLVIDAESEYQGKYAAAQTYITRLRKLIGNRFPVGLAGFPYVGYHLTFPYSVFLGPNGAQYNLPQMYWADIGTTVQSVYAITYEYNEIYRRPIFPLGQLWNSGRGMSVGPIEQFNTFAAQYGASGESWWDWQSAPRSYFNAITKTGPLLVSYGGVNRTPASIFRGNKGDLVIWAQEHLYGAGYKVTVDGQFGPQTQSAVKAFQRKHRLTATGVINGLTWDALVRVTPVTVKWTRKKNQTVAVVARSARVAGRATTTLIQSVPAWMKRVRSHNELHGDFGAGSPSTAKR